jgi:adenylate cyclase class 2
MPLEIEIKLKLDSHDSVLARLAALQARHVGMDRETNIYFDRADGSLRRADTGLRVRLTASSADTVPKALLTFKGPAAAEGMRSREAFDLEVAPQEQVVPLLRALGFEQVLLFEKDRDSWRVGECLVELDTLPVFGCFVEIEGPSEEVVRGVQEELGLANLEQERKSYSQMVSDYLQKESSVQLRFRSD